MPSGQFFLMGPHQKRKSAENLEILGDFSKTLAFFEKSGSMYLSFQQNIVVYLEGEIIP